MTDFRKTKKPRKSARAGHLTLITRFIPGVSNSKREILETRMNTWFQRIGQFATTCLKRTVGRKAIQREALRAVEGWRPTVKESLSVRIEHPGLHDLFQKLEAIRRTGSHW